MGIWIQVEVADRGWQGDRTCSINEIPDMPLFIGPKEALHFFTFIVSVYNYDKNIKFVITRFFQAQIAPKPVSARNPLPNDACQTPGGKGIPSHHCLLLNSFGAVGPTRRRRLQRLGSQAVIFNGIGNTLGYVLTRHISTTMLRTCRPSPGIILVYGKLAMGGLWGSVIRGGSQTRKRQTGVVCFILSNRFRHVRLRLFIDIR